MLKFMITNFLEQPNFWEREEVVLEGFLHIFVHDGALGEGFYSKNNTIRSNSFKNGDCAAIKLGKPKTPISMKIFFLILSQPCLSKVGKYIVSP
jgi:hypothetical protein